MSRKVLTSVQFNIVSCVKLSYATNPAVEVVIPVVVIPIVSSPSIVSVLGSESSTDTVFTAVSYTHLRAHET